MTGTPPNNPSPGALARAATPRALALGVAASVFVNVASPYTESTGFSNFSWSYVPEGGVLPFLLLMALNAALKRIRPRWALTVPELLLVLAMALAANCTSIFLMYFLCSAIVSPHYFASPENRWDEDLIPYLKPWTIVSDDNHAAYWFYEGLPPGRAIPWHDWALPLAAWMPFLVALLVGSLAMVGLLRRQWLEHEKLSYPLMRLPLELVGRGPAGGRTGHQTSPAVGACGSFWIGALIPLAFGVLDLIRGLVPSFPSVIVDHLGSLWFANWTPGPHFPQLQINLNFLALSSGFFVPTDVLCGLWVFYLLTKLVQEPIINRLGLGAGSAGMFVWGQASTSWQSFGAFTVLVAGVLWSSRAHLRRVWELATGLESRGCARCPAHGTRDQPPRPAVAGPVTWTTVTPTTRDETRSSRIALIAFVASLAVMVIWLHQTGMNPVVAAVFVMLVIALYLGVARIVCQSGIFYLVPAMIAQNPIIYALGPSAVGRQGMVALGLSYAWHGDVQTVLAALGAQCMKLEEQAPMRRGELSGGMLLSALVGLVVAPLGIILTAYPKGALRWSTWVFKGWGPNTYNQILGQISAGQRGDWFNALYYAGGFGAMLGLTALRNRFAWWPLHPLGLAAVSSFTIYAVYLPFLVAWLVKTAMLRWGGFRTYRAATPFFIGLGVGHYLARALALIGYTALGIQWRL